MCVCNYPQTHCFVVSQFFSVARPIGRLKLGSKLYVRLSLIPLSQQANHVGLPPPRVASSAVSALTWLWLQLLDCDSCDRLSDCGYQWIYNFITPTRSYVVHVNLLHLLITCFPDIIFFFAPLEHPVPEILDWRLCQRSMCNNTSHSFTANIASTVSILNLGDHPATPWI